MFMFGTVTSLIISSRGQIKAHAMWDKVDNQSWIFLNILDSHIIFYWWWFQC